MAGEIYIVRSRELREKPPGSPMQIDADEQGRVLFRESVQPEKIQSSIPRYIELAKDALMSVQGKVADFEVSEITIKLGVDAEVGCVLIADASIEAAIEVKLQRRHQP
jgi:hypothetical protein